MFYQSKPLSVWCYYSPNWGSAHYKFGFRIWKFDCSMSWRTY